MYRANQNKRYRRIKRELIHKGALVDFYKDTMQVPNGNLAEWDLISHKGAAAVIPVTSNGDIIMVRQYRNPLEDFDLEIPAGSLDSPAEDPKVCAARELEEETGCKAQSITYVNWTYASVGICTERIYLYIAENLQPGTQKLDKDEFIEIERYSLKDALEMVYDGTIRDSKTVMGILAYNQLVTKRKGQ